MEAVVMFLGYNRDSMSFKFLGINVGYNPIRVGAWDFVINKGR